MIPFSPPRIDQKILDEVSEALRSGWITTGPRTKLFEKKINEYIGSKKTVCLNSATAGLELVLRWYGVQEGDEVIVPAYTYSSTGNVVLHCGAKVVFVDAQADFNVDPQAIKDAITSKTKVIMSVDLGGYPVDYDEIMAIAQSEEIKALFQPRNKNQEQLARPLVLADSAHAFGARYKGKMLGSIVDAHGFSFHAVKNLSTAEGGCVCFNLPDSFDHEALYKHMCIISLHGQTKDALAKTQKGNWRYDIVEAGYKCNMTDLSAALGLVELERYESETLPRRKDIMERYHEAFSSESWAECPAFLIEKKQSSYHLYMLRIKGVEEGQRDEIIQRIFDKEVSVNVHFQPLPLFTAYKRLGYSISDYPKACDNYSREISLPIYYDLSIAEQEQVIAAVKSAVTEVIGI